jgi:hypothetical protein
MRLPTSIPFTVLKLRLSSPNTAFGFVHPTHLANSATPHFRVFSEPIPDLAPRPHAPSSYARAHAEPARAPLSFGRPGSQNVAERGSDGATSSHTGRSSRSKVQTHRTDTGTLKNWITSSSDGATRARHAVPAIALLDYYYHPFSHCPSIRRVAHQPIPSAHARPPRLRRAVAPRVGCSRRPDGTSCICCALRVSHRTPLLPSMFTTRRRAQIYTLLDGYMCCLPSHIQHVHTVNMYFRCPPGFGCVQLCVPAGFTAQLIRLCFRFAADQDDLAESVRARRASGVRSHLSVRLVKYANTAGLATDIAIRRAS